MKKKRNVFIISALEDRQFLRYFLMHLKPLELQGLITVWDESQVVAGSERRREIDEHLNHASIILLLVSVNLMASEEIYLLAQQAVIRNAPPSVYVVPVLVHEVDWEYSAFGGLSPLPANRQPVSSWMSENAAFFAIVKGIRGIVEHMQGSEGLILPVHSVLDRQAMQERASSSTLGRRHENHFDVFLCYNRKDRPEVKEMAKQLQMQGIIPWLDEWELRPGLPWQRTLEQQIGKINAAAVFVGAEDIGPWQNMEIEALLHEFVRRGCPVIPVLLKTARAEPKLPLFLANMTWVDFHMPEPEPMGQLIWAITNEKPVID